MQMATLENFRSEIANMQTVFNVGRVVEISQDTLVVKGFSNIACLGDRVRILARRGVIIGGEVLHVSQELVTILPEQSTEGMRIGNRVELIGEGQITPHQGWIGRVIDPSGRPLDGLPPMLGGEMRALQGPPPNATERRPLGVRLETGLSVFNTMLPIVRGQRIGLFAGSGVGKSTLLADLAQGVQADVVVIALIGERGREVREFVDHVLGPEGMKRAVVVAATSDQSPLLRRRCAWTAMAVAEYFRDQGQHVLFLADSITRFAEAHREIALAGGEESSLRGYPPSTSHMIMSLCERAGPGTEYAGDITAVFSVLVAGADMDEPIADILRGVLDGHVVLEREIAERGRFPAINLLRSVSRSLPKAASDDENRIITHARQMLGAYDRAELMIQAGLYATGSDPTIDAAIEVWPKLDRFLAQKEPENTTSSFNALAACLDLNNTQNNE